MPLKCTKTKADGSPCLAPAMRGADVCFFHATNDEVKAAERKRDDELDIAAELRRQLRRAKRLPPSVEKERLLLDIAKAVKDAEGEKGGAENKWAKKEGETTQEWVARLRKK